jgi:hypothetical protein
MRITLFLVAALVALAGCGATVRPPIVWTVAGTMDDGEDCIATNDTTPWPATASRTLIVQARRVGTTTWAEVLRVAAAAGTMQPEIAVASFGMWEIRGMVADSTGAGCWSDTVSRIAMTRPSKVGAR